MNFKRLLAKSLPQRESKTAPATKAARYAGHLALVNQSAEVLLQQLGPTIIQQLGLESIDPDYFANTVRLGAYLHDWGKANQHFQEMVCLKSLDSKSADEKIRNYRKKLQKSWQDHDNRQMLRHEVLSGILALRVPSFRHWLDQCPDADFMVAVWAAMGHHLKLREEVAEIPDGTGSELKIYTDHEDFTAVLKMGKRLGLPAALPERPQQKWSKSQLQKELTALRGEFVKIENQIIEEEDWKRQKFIAAVKATVIAADLAGSAIPVAGYSLKDWMQQVLGLVLSDGDIQQLLDERLKDKPLRPFQEQIAGTPHRVTLVKAGCGTGKTVGAYAWAKKWAAGRKLFFGYPTTGTASQGYMDYAAETEIETALMHSRAEIDLEEILFSGDSDDSEGIDARLAAFRAWQAKLIVCTVDSVLGLIQNNRKPLYSWPAICQSAFVFDEVHAYDESLFGALLCFLKTFRGAPILLMSASFTQGQLDAIGQVMDELGEPVQIIEGPQNLEIFPRYQIQSISLVSHPEELPEVWPAVLEALRQQQKVLWVTNSVRSCIQLYRLAETMIAENLSGVPVNRLIYHSRYRYKDRLQKHKAVIEAFNPEREGPVLAITTQVCEMSLDLSADLLVSAMAPAAALIQRLGRLNRRVIEDDLGNVRLASGRICSAIIYPWNDDKPYKPAELLTGRQFVDKLGRGAISQLDLSEVAAELASNTPTPVTSNWLEGHWCTYPGFLREAGYTITVLLEEDVAEIRKAANVSAAQVMFFAFYLALQGGFHKIASLLMQDYPANQRKDKSFIKEAQRWSVPVRIVPGFQEWRRIGFYPVAPPDRVSYTEETGAEEL